MKLNKDYIIPFVGLKLGVHSFEFNVTDTFFEYFEYSIIHKGEVKVNLSLEKRETMLVGDFTVNGTVEAECDRCGDVVNVEVEGEYQLVYKFDDEPSDDESLIIVYPEEFEINVAENLLELITVSLPSRAVHDEGDCNEEMMTILDEYILVSDSEVEASEGESEDEPENDENIDPRWSALKNLKK
ncbi:MAG: DUF177 domain-containing protein [Crocinitomicaceae bacterium]|nr:DUF177 domain-containing protein [Crocinitomicaceae bacterium]